MKTVKCGTVPGVLREFQVEDDATIEDVLELAEIDLGNRTVMMNGANVDTDDEVEQNATITVTQKIKGN